MSTPAKDRQHCHVDACLGSSCSAHSLNNCSRGSRRLDSHRTLDWARNSRNHKLPAIMQLNLPRPLNELVRDKYAVAKSKDALTFSPTELSVISTSSGILVRECTIVAFTKAVAKNRTVPAPLLSRSRKEAQI